MNRKLKFIIELIVAVAVLAILSYAAYRRGYKAGYTASLVNQEAGLPHDYVLREHDSGEWLWVPGKGECYPYKLGWEK